jgi:hypothetical protein
MDQSKMTRKAMKQALEALEEVKSWTSPTRWDGCFDEEITALRQALEQAEKQERVAVHQYRIQGCSDWYDGYPDPTDKNVPNPYEERTLYTTSQPQREWVGLTDEEIDSIPLIGRRLTKFARAIEAKLKEKNT